LGRHQRAAPWKHEKDLTGKMKSPLRILYLEDDPRDAELIQEVLAADSITCEATRVETKADFVTSLEQCTFDLILADYTLPSFDGLSALKIARQGWPSIPFIFVSGTLDEEVAIETLKVGATDYVFKTRLARIVPSVRRALREQQERTELDRAEKALRRSEAYLAEAQKLSHTGSFGWDVSSGEIYWSQETFRIFAYEPATNVTIEWILERTHPEDRSAVRVLIDRVSRERKEFDFEHRLLLPDGSVKHVRVVGQPSKDESGGFEFVGAVTDVTAHKQAEEERERLRQAQADLAHVTRMTTMGELTASLAHEINQPIAAAITNSNTCLRWLTRNPPDVEEAREAASRTAKDATRAADIIRRIRLLFQKGAPQQELVDVNEVIREMMALLGSEADRCLASIRADLATDLPKVVADRVQLQQVFTNLMLNGIEAMKDAGTLREVTIKSERASNSHLLISVSDTGVGLAPNQTDEIFKPFYSTKPTGIGMGLAISRSIIESHGGRLWAAANNGPGATFRFTLPNEVEARQ
jgi:PAS domain S-box-containing protein